MKTTVSQVGRAVARAAHRAEARCRGHRQDAGQLALDFDVDVADWREQTVAEILGPWVGPMEQDQSAPAAQGASEC